jgi:PAS domain S-box-containing protein
MNVYAVVTLLSSILCSLFAAVVFCSNKKETLNRVFAVSGLAAAYLLFYYFMCLQAESASTAYVWMKLGSFWFFVISCYFHFVLVFTERKKLLKNALTYVLLYAPALFFALVNLTTDTFIGERYRYDWGGYSAYEMPQHPSWLHYVMVAWVIAMAAAGFALCLQYHIARKDRLVQKKSAIVLFSFTLPFLLTVVEEILILAQVKIRIPIIDVVSIVWLNAWMGYAIWKYDLFKIDPVKAAENIIATMPDTLVLVDRNGAIAGVNRSLLAMLDVAEQDLVGQPVSRLFAMESTSVAGGGIGERLLPGMEAENREAWLLTKDGRKIPVLLSVSAVRQRGINIGLVCVAKDITERKVAEELLLEANTRLQQSNRELQEFAHVASHDLQEPLRKIGIFGERLLETYRQAPEKEGRDHLEKIMDAAARMQRLINALLAYARVTVTSGAAERVDLAPVVREVLSDLEARIEEEAALVECGSLPAVFADPTQLRQLFQNLIGNALKFHQPGIPPHVRIYARDGVREGAHTVVVEDEGIGIEAQYHDKIFGVFERLHGKDRYDGNGIGLAVCKKIMERTGGTIRVESQPGEGTKFIVSWPLTGSAARPAPANN